MIKCKLLELGNIPYDFGYENLPETIEEIKISGADDTSMNIILIGIKKRNLQNLHTLDFSDCLNCSALTKVYENFVVPLSPLLKTIRVHNCNNFNEYDLLTANWIKCILY
jgi:hypothetical protein